MAMCNYTGRRIFIHDADSNSIANTTVSAYNSQYMVVSVKEDLSKNNNSEFVSVLILTDDGVHEYQGKFHRSAHTMLTDIALFKGKVVENRAAQRYAINTTAFVESLIIDDLVVPLLNPLTVFAVNMSATGALLRSLPNSFNLESILEFKLNIGGKATTLYAKVVRVQNTDPASAEYGCEFISA